MNSRTSSRGLFVIGEANFFQGSLDLGFGVAVGQHGDKKFFVVFIDEFPAFG